MTAEHLEKGHRIPVSFFVVLEAGVEPARGVKSHWILSPARLPIPPLERTVSISHFPARNAIPVAAGDSMNPSRPRVSHGRFPLHPSSVLRMLADMMRTHRRVLTAPMRICLLLLLGTMGMCFNATSQALFPRTFLLHVLSGRQTPNFIRPTSAALDPWRGVLYLASSDVATLSVVETRSGRQRASLALPATLPLPFTLRHVHARSRLILGSRTDLQGIRTEISAIDPLSGSIAGRLLLDSATGLHFVSHPDANLIFLSTGHSQILILDGATLQPVDSIDAGMPTGGMALDSVHQQLFVTQAQPVNGLMRVKTFSTSTLQQTRVFVYSATQPMDRIAVDAELQRFALIGEGSIRLFDEFGLPLREFPISAPIGDVAYSEASNRLLVLDPTGRSRLNGNGRYGTVYRISLDAADVDSIAVGLDAFALLTDRVTNEAITVNRGSSSVDVMYVPDRSLRRTVWLGHSIEAIAIPDRSNNVLVTNAEGSGITLSVVDIERRSLHAVEAGIWPVGLTKDPVNARIIATSNFEAVLRSVDTEDGFILRQLRIPDAPEFRGDAYPSVACNADGIAIAVYPEWEHYAVVNIDLGTVLRIGKVDGYRFLGGRGPGMLQAAFTGRGNHFGILRPESRSINVYATTSPGLLRTIDLSFLDWSRVQPFLGRCLKSAEAIDAFRLGPYRVHAITGATDSIAITGAVEVLGADPTGRVWAIRHDGLVQELLSSSSGTFADSDTNVLLDASESPDAVDVNFARRALALGYTSSGTLLLYTLPSITFTPEIHVRFMENALLVYPNPVRAGGQAYVQVENSLSSSAIRDETAIFSVVDMLGRTVYSDAAASGPWCSGAASRSLPALQAGTYRSLLSNRNGVIAAGVFVVVK